MEKKLTCDLLIIGGGINGCGIAAEAATRGLKVILCEKNDLGSATSSASSKLVHGGLRYLEQYNFSLVRKALKERETLLKICPYLIQPLKFILPHQKHLRPFWFIRTGLFIYDFLCKTSFKKSRTISRERNNTDFSPLKPNIKQGFTYYDAKTLDSRLVVINALQAEKYHAKILTNAEFIETNRSKERWLSTLMIDNKSVKIESKVLVNATGPWADILNSKLKIKTPYQLSLVQGSHLVFDKMYEHDAAYILQHTDDRIIFTLPYQNEFTLVGTTELKVNTPEKKCDITEEEISYLLTVINNHFTKQLTKKDIKHIYCGMRPLIKTKKSFLAKNIPRDYKIYLDKEKALYACVFGGKLTTYRLLSKECIDAFHPLFPKLDKSKTDTLALPGSNFKSMPLLISNLMASFPYLSISLIEHYASTYGSRAFDLLTQTTDLKELGKCFSKNCYQLEVDFLIKNEWAKTIDDIIWRRTKHGLFMKKIEIEHLKKYILSVT